MSPENIQPTPEAAHEEVKPATEAERPAELKHSIDAYYVGLPGAEKLVSDAVTNEQLGVRQIETNDVVGLKKTVIEQREADAIESLAEKSIEEQGQIAQETLESSKAEADDMVKISELLESKKDVILTVDADSITDTRIPKENALHLLIKQSEMEPIKKLLEESDYYLEDIEEIGLKAKKGTSELVFIYAKESK